MRLLIAGALLCLSFAASAAVTLSERTQVNLLRGSTTIETLPSWDACTARARELAKADTRTSGTVTFSCQTEKRQVVATYSPTVANRSPTISGTPPATVQVGQAYLFQPTASDPDGDALSFSMVNRPAWAQFDTATGRLSGTPSAANDGFHAGLKITVTDSKASASTPEFSITVRLSTVPSIPTTPTTPAVGTASLSWTPPTLNDAGSALNDLAGYLIVYGRSPDVLTGSINLPSAAASTYVMTGLESGAWYFAMRAYNASGTASALSNVTSKTVQ